MTTPRIILFAFALTLAGCNRGQQQAQQAPQAMPVQTAPVKAQTVEIASEYLGTIRSRNSAVLQPQVEGYITRIFVHSGEKVAAGARILQIDPLKQEATVNTQEASQRSRTAQLQLAQKQLQRSKELAQAGVISKQELDQAQAGYDAARADAESVQASVKEQREQLRYYMVTAPAAGTIGDVPVRVGDRVSTSTVLTTLDSSQALEIYVSIPSERAAEVKTGTPVDVLNAEGKPQRTRVSFVSPRVDPATQLLLVKAELPPGPAWKNEQEVHVRVIWNEKQLPVIPFTAVSRLSGNLFAFVTEKAGDKTVARQRQLSTGDMVGNDYSILAGLKPGEELITSNVQMLADGMPVQPIAAQGGTK